MSFKDYQLEFAPPWLRGPFGAQWHAALGGQKDEFANRAKATIVAHVPGIAPTDALGDLGLERGILRGPSETAAHYRERLRLAHTAWAFAGTKGGVRSVFDACGFTVNIYAAVNSDGPFNWMVSSPSEVFIHIVNGAAMYSPESLWGAVGAGAYWDSAETHSTWGSTATLEEAAFIKALMKTWLPAFALRAYAIVVWDCELWGLSTLDADDDFSWGYDTIPSAQWGGVDGTTGRAVYWNAWDY